MPPTRFNPFSAPPSGVAHIDAHVGCYRWPPHPYNFPTLENGCAPKKKRDRRGEPATFTTGWYYIYIYEYHVYIYIYIPKKCHLHGASKFINHEIFRHPMFSQSSACRHPPNITAWWVPSCHSPSSGWSNIYWSTSKILRVDHCFSRINYSILQSPSICPFAKKHEPSAKWLVEFATLHPIRIQYIFGFVWK